MTANYDLSNLEHCFKLMHTWQTKSKLCWLVYHSSMQALEEKKGYLKNDGP